MTHEFEPSDRAMDIEKEEPIFITEITNTHPSEFTIGYDWKQDEETVSDRNPSYTSEDDVVITGVYWNSLSAKVENILTYEDEELINLSENIKSYHFPSSRLKPIEYYK